MGQQTNTQPGTETLSKSRHEQILDTIDEVTNISANLGIAQLQVEDEFLNGRTVHVKPLLPMAQVPAL